MVLHRKGKLPACPHLPRLMTRLARRFDTTRIERRPLGSEEAKFIQLGRAEIFSEFLLRCIDGSPASEFHD